MTRWTGEAPDLTPDQVDVDGQQCPVTFTHRLGTYVARIAMPDGTTLVGPARETKASAKTSAWWHAIRRTAAGRHPPAA